MAVSKFEGRIKIVAGKVQASPQGTPAFYRIAEVHFPSIQSLARADSEGGKQTVPHAVSISSRGAPILLVAEDETGSGFKILLRERIRLFAIGSKAS